MLVYSYVFWLFDNLPRPSPRLAAAFGLMILTYTLYIKGILRQAGAVLAFLSRVFDNPGLADEGYLNLARIFEFLFYLKRDIAGHQAGFRVGYLFRSDENTDFAAGLEGIRLLHGGEGIDQGFQFLQAL